jgi:hypothetical protein
MVARSKQKRVQQGTWTHGRCGLCDPEILTRTAVDDDLVLRWATRTRTCEGILVDFHLALETLDKVRGWTPIVRVSTRHANLHVRHYRRLSAAVQDTDERATIDCAEDMMDAYVWALKYVMPETEGLVTQWRRRM